MSGAGAPADVPRRDVVGLIGLGIMGSWYARHLLEAGWPVTGYDPSGERMAEFAEAGGVPCASGDEVIDRSRFVVVALSSVPAFEALMLGDAAGATRARPGQLFLELGTLPLPLKEAARQAVERRGARMIDAPVTGTRVHAERKALVVYASGDASDVDEARPVMEGFADDVRYVGRFGAGMKLKMITNHLVAIHNVATAEALALAATAGLDPRLVYDSIASGPASSAVFGFRGPLMVDRRYEPATMRMDVFEKDLNIIGDFAAALNAATPLFDASLAIYREALTQGMRAEDVAATFEILKGRSAARGPADRLG